MKKAFWLFLCTILLIGTTASTAMASPIRVALQQNASSVTFKVNAGEYTVSGGLPSRELGILEQGSTLSASYSGGSWTLSVDGETWGTVSPPIAVAESDDDDKNLLTFKSVRYRGGFGLLTKGLVINIVDMEDYLKGVVGKEIGYDAPMQALEAQAVASRSYGYANIASSASYDVAATTASQVYGGYDAEISTNGTKVVQAVENTADLVMYYEMDDGSYVLVPGFYHAHAGGYTENIENIWGVQALPYLQAVESPYDSTGPSVHNSWTVTYTPDELTELINKYKTNRSISGDFGDFTSLEIYSENRTGGGATASGRITKVVANGTKGQLIVYRDDIRSFLSIKSTLFTINNQSVTSSQDCIYVLDAVGEPVKKEWNALYSYGKDGVATLLSKITGVFVKNAAKSVNLDGASVVANTNIVINGKGWGHGVGMSQWGARGMADDGYTYEEILQHYYGGSDQTRLILAEIGSFE